MQLTTFQYKTNLNLFNGPAIPYSGQLGEMIAKGSPT